jgi:hypothetical protein
LIVGSDNAGRKMEPWMIDMLGSNTGGSHDQNIVVPNMPVENKSCKNKMVIQNNVHGSYFI